jgi:hypothetical protein
MMLLRLNDWYREHQLVVVIALGIPLALGFVAASVIVAFAMGLAGVDVQTILRAQLLLGVVLSPATLLVVAAIRRQVPTLLGDVFFLWSASMLVGILIGRLFNVGFLNPWLIYGGLLLLTVSLAVSAAVAVADGLRFRTARLCVPVVLTFVVLAVPLPHIGFEAERECLIAYKDRVLSDREFAATGRCGPVAWSQARVHSDGSVQLPDAAGLLTSGSGYLWSGQPVAACVDTEVYLCASLEPLGNGWFFYKKRRITT